MFKNLCLEALGLSGSESEAIELTLSHGFKGIDLDIGPFAQQVDSQGFERASRRITSARLKIGSFALPTDWDAGERKAGLDKLRKLVEIAAQMGCTRATTILKPGGDRPYHENFEQQRRSLQELATMLAEHKIKLGVGLLAPIACRSGYAFQFMQTADELMLLLRSVGGPQIGLAFDSWHWHLGGGTLDGLRALSSEQIVTVTLSDIQPDMTSANATLDDRALPGASGAIDNAALLAALAEKRYDGPVSVAAARGKLAGTGREQVVKSAATALDTVWKAAGLSTAGKLASAAGR